MTRPRASTCSRGWRAAVLGALVLAGCVTGGGRSGGPGPAVRPEGAPPPLADASRVRTLITPSAALPSAGNAIWSAGSNLAWDALSDAVREVGPLRLGPPADPGLVDALNARPFPHGDLDAASVLVTAGFVKDGVARRFEQEFARRFPGERFGVPVAPGSRDTDVMAYAYVKKDLPFRNPFHVRIERMSFAGGPARVVAFGLDPDAKGRDVASIAAQAVFHAAPAGATGPEASDFLAELSPRDDSDRIVLAAIQRPTSLAAGWTRAAALRAGKGETLAAGVDLAVPKIDFAAESGFPEIVGAPIENMPVGGRITEARQRVELTLSELGARFRSSTAMGLSCSAPPQAKRVRFDRPFLLALIRRGASHPYFLAWFGDDSLFVREGVAP